MPEIVYSITFNIFLFLHVLVCVLLGLVVLMQRPKQEGLGAAFAGGMMNESFGAQTTDVLQKATRFLAICFFVLATLMAMIKAHQNKDMVIAPAETAAEVAPADQDTPAESADDQGGDSSAAETTPETADPADAPAGDNSSEAPAPDTSTEPAPDAGTPEAETPAADGDAAGDQGSGS